MQYAKQIQADLVIVDTAGRLQTKSNLMAELAKIRRVIAKEIDDAPDEVFLIIDATTGQNGVLQAKAFAEATGLTGVVITKMDGTSKGGIILAIRDEIGVPVRFIGLGEKLDDMTEFDLEKYLYGLCLGDE
jgi:fused signal recognition particle receptor